MLQTSNHKNTSPMEKKKYAGVSDGPVVEPLVVFRPSTLYSALYTSQKHLAADPSAHCSTVVSIRDHGHSAPRTHQSAHAPYENQMSAPVQLFPTTMPCFLATSSVHVRLRECACIWRYPATSQMPGAEAYIWYLNVFPLAGVIYMTQT